MTFLKQMKKRGQPPSPLDYVIFVLINVRAGYFTAFIQIYISRKLFRANHTIQNNSPTTTLLVSCRRSVNRAIITIELRADFISYSSRTLCKSN